MSARGIKSSFGMVAEFETAGQVLAAAEAAHLQGFRRIDAFTPYLVEGLAEALGMRGNLVPLLTLVGGLAGAASGYFLQWYSAVVDYPLDVGGRGLHSWPAFVPITFELTVLFAALSAISGMLACNGLPRLHHPVFYTPHFTERNGSRFYLCIEARDRKFDPEKVRALFSKHGAEQVWEVPQ